MTSNPEEIRAEATAYENAIQAGLEALLLYYDPNYEWPAPELETYDQVAAALRQWPGRRARFVKALESDFLLREGPGPAEALQWLVDVIHLQLTLDKISRSLQQEQEMLEAALEQWLERMAEPLQEEPGGDDLPANNPACYKTDLFGNPIEEYLETKQEQQ